MFRRFAVTASILFVFAAGAVAVSAQDWDNLGTREVKDKTEQDTWHLGASKGQYRRLKITVQQRPVKFYRLRVTYGNGQKQEFQIANLIRPGGSTRALDLDGKDRYIDKVDIWYEASTAGRGVRSQVTLLGLK